MPRGHHHVGSSGGAHVATAVCEVSSAIPHLHPGICVWEGNRVLFCHPEIRVVLDLDDPGSVDLQHGVKHPHVVRIDVNRDEVGLSRYTVPSEHPDHRLARDAR
eukprot:CAMPEP_0181187328 /NCGR_PEP_ID=MMETSP1096-20121128/10512_1 /TAXON_ID=156174 ORGANISM="Chrysochromulina ericina, Strain CCMP281" /NCGR_SAMPLE_ID=MMETSP1096 /ASSEMBLY_ACC=CAM_ASM_000453 /LENGTH=103 /DNA_ID=CAMNT_0023276291 /DNA_START=551 /DNA_END=862 /DNA_ORIENTATION=+